MAATHKAVSMVRTLAENLALRTGLAVVTGVDSSGNPYIQIGALTAASQSAFLLIKQDYDPALEVDGIGNTQRRYTPHVAKLVLEESATDDVTVLTGANLAKILKEVVELGTKIEIYYAANTTALSLANAEAAITAANLKVTLDSLWQPMLSTI